MRLKNGILVNQDDAPYEFQRIKMTSLPQLFKRLAALNIAAEVTWEYPTTAEADVTVWVPKTIHPPWTVATPLKELEAYVKEVETQIEADQDTIERCSNDACECHIPEGALKKKQAKKIMRTLSMYGFEGEATKVRKGQWMVEVYDPYPSTEEETELILINFPDEVDAAFNRLQAIRAKKWRELRLGETS